MFGLVLASAVFHFRGRRHELLRENMMNCESQIPRQRYARISYSATPKRLGRQAGQLGRAVYGAGLRRQSERVWARAPQLSSF